MDWPSCCYGKHCHPLCVSLFGLKLILLSSITFPSCVLAAFLVSFFSNLFSFLSLLVSFLLDDLLLSSSLHVLLSLSRVQAIIHPDTGEKIFMPFRMSGTALRSCLGWAVSVTDTAGLFGLLMSLCVYLVLAELCLMSVSHGRFLLVIGLQRMGYANKYDVIKSCTQHSSRKE